MSIAITVTGQTDVYTKMHDALAVAAAGDTVTVTMADNDILTGGNNDNGAGQTLHYVVTGGTVANNIGTLGGFVQLAGASTSINASGVLFYGNTSSNSSTGNFTGGGAVSAGPFVNKSYETITISNSTFTRNCSAAHGGALTSAGSITVTDSEFNYNYAASYGGAMFFRQNNPPLRSFSGVSLTGNTAKYGGAVAFYLGSPQSFLGDSGRNVFTDNVAETDGGAIHVNFGNLSITAADFIGNTAGGNGGAIYYSTNGSTLTLSNTTFRGNTARTNGGALYNGKTAEVNGNVSFLTESDTIYNVGTLNVTGTNTFNASITGTGVFNAKGGTMIFGNTAAIDVAGLTFSGSNTLKFTGSAQVNFTQDGGQDLSGVTLIIDNAGYESGTTVTVATGVSAVGTVNFTCIPNQFVCTLTDGTLNYTAAAGFDASITVSSVPGVTYLSMERALAAAQTGDTVTVTLGENNVLSGGVNDNGAGQTLDYVVTGGTVAGNIAAMGGAFYLMTGGTLTANHVLFAGNIGIEGGSAATFQGGGAISGGSASTSSNSHLYLTDVTFSGNSVKGSGGAVLSYGSGTFTNVTFTGNTSSVAGGALIHRKDLLSMKNVSFINNRSGDRAGAVYLMEGTISISADSGKRNTFSGNSGVFGGAICFNRNNSTVDGADFFNNSARSTQSNRGGGAIYVDGGTQTVSNSTFTGNTALNYGGAVYVNANRGLDLNHVLFSGNTTVNRGGNAIYNASGATLNLSGGTFATALDMIENYGTLTVTGTNYFNASVTGTGTIDVNNSTMIFGNSEAISVAALTLSGNNAMAFNGAAAVNFASQDLSDVAVTVDASVYAGSEITVATGVTGFGGYTLTGTDNAALFLKVEDGSLVLYERTADLADGQTETNFVGGTANLITGGTVTAAFFGTRKNSFGSVRTVFTGGTVANSMVGGALVQAKDAANTALDTVMLDIHNGVSLLGGPSNGGMNYVAGYAYGRSDWTALPGSANYTVGEAVLNLSGSSISGNLYAGAHARKYAYTSVAAATVNVTGGTVEKLYGGGWAERGDKSITGGTVAKSDVGTATVNISGGSINRLYAGGGNSLYGYTNVGTANLTISGGTVDFVFLGGRNNNCFVDNATLTITGDAQTLTRVSGKTDSGVDNTGSAILNVQTDVTLDYLDYVDRINIAEACTLNITELVLYDDISQELSVYLGTDGFDDVWTLLSAGDTTKLDLLSTAQFFVNNTACAMGGSVDIGGDSYRLDKSGLGITLSKIG